MDLAVLDEDLFARAVPSEKSSYYQAYLTKTRPAQTNWDDPCTICARAAGIAIRTV
jgi:hypothetical protein